MSHGARKKNSGLCNLAKNEIDKEIRLLLLELCTINFEQGLWDEVDSEEYRNVAISGSIEDVIQILENEDTFDISDLKESLENN